jgi:hypothetical protein
MDGLGEVWLISSGTVGCVEVFMAKSRCGWLIGGMDG